MQKYKILDSIPEDVSKELSGFSDFTKHLLFYRGILNSKDANKFLNIKYEDISNPYLFKDMDKTVDRILLAIKNKEKIAIFSDYDADGIPGAVIMSDFLYKINYENFIVYIPHRNDEGYGLNPDAIKYLKSENVSLIITIDCGISDHQNVSLAKELGMDVIITDHHLPHKTLPTAFSILNPKQEGCLYPEKMLCGAGVIFKLVCAILENENFKNNFSDIKIISGWEKWLLDMAGLATLSDMVPLLGENRILAYFGLRVLRKTQRHGLLKLFSILKIDKANLNEDDVGFLITPRINVASRMGHPKDAFVMLSSKDEALSISMAEHLHKVNDERKGVVLAMTKEIRKIIEERKDVLRDVIVLGNPKWKPSLLGLVANSFSETENRPVFLWGREGDGLIKGSCRSSTVSVMDLMGEVSSFFSEYGGHLSAGGFSLTFDKIHLLDDVLNNAFIKISKNKEGNQLLKFVDKVVEFKDVSWKLWNEIEKFAPFGVSNPKPVFMLENIDIYEVKHFGKEKNHLEISFPNSGNGKIKAIAFFKTKDDFEPLVKGLPVNIVFNLEKSNFRNFPELRLRILDIF